MADMKVKRKTMEPLAHVLSEKNFDRMVFGDLDGILGLVNGDA